jgi:general secretion pathway protein G
MGDRAMRTQVLSARKSGFTLIEILIVVIILGILAAIVIPQFSNASTEARESAMRSMQQTVRSQVELYKLQHADLYPTSTGAIAASVTWEWAKLTGKTTAAGATSTTGEFGPYLPQVPQNSLRSSATGVAVVHDADVTASYDNDTAGIGYVIDQTGRFFALDASGNPLMN